MAIDEVYLNQKILEYEAAAAQFHNLQIANQGAADALKLALANLTKKPEEPKKAKELKNAG